ncbi:helix-turn-helix domain-containing protein [Dissulfurispira sp.]|uniref:helix-turn-helix domain-containing protein n=1 Tax=Dissulfurispira sp. TaxID=2817609 RepID=UPI003FA5B5D6
MPSLRERRDDIPLLAHHFLDRYRERFGKDIQGFTTEVMDTLLTYDWPGNVRELEHVIERAVILEYGKKIGISSLPAELRSRPREIMSSKSVMRLEDMERQLIQSTLRFFDGKRDSAARALGISTATLWRKLKKYNLD